MMNTEEQKLRLHSKTYVSIIIIVLAISGLTEFPLETEMAYLVKYIEILPVSLQTWLRAVYQALKATNLQYPFLSYGTDWLAFAHIMLAILFIGPLKDPVKKQMGNRLWYDLLYCDYSIGINCRKHPSDLSILANDRLFFWHYWNCPVNIMPH